MKKKIIAVLLSACMLVSACPTGAFAMSDEETNTYTATGDVMQGGTSVVDETSAPEATEAPEQTPTPAPEETATPAPVETPTPAPAETPAPVEVEAQATPAAGAEETAPAKQSAETGIALTMLRPDDEKPTVDTYRFYGADGKELTEWQQTVAKGDELLEPPAPTKENARFVGWYVGKTPLSFGEVAAVSGTEVTVTAKFEVYSYVYFMNEDGTQVVYYTAAGKAGETVGEDILNAATAKVELTMGKEKGVVGWSTTPKSETVETITFVAGDRYVYPVVKAGFWVTFDTDGGDYIAPQFRMEQLNLNTVTPTRSGYTFTGWHDAEGNPVTKVSDTATVTAHWTASNKTEYTVIHWQENANDDEYSSKDIEKKTGATNSTTNARAKSYSGFTAQTIEQKTIAGDGSTIVNVYYKRNVYSVKFYTIYDYSFFGYSYKEDTSLRITAKYGANIRDKWPNKPESAWNVSTDGNTWQAGIDVMPLNGATFYQRGQNSSHTMVASYYLETISGGKYELDHQDTVYGKGDSVTKEDRYAITGFKLNESKSTRIGRDYNGAKFYYDRESYSIVFMNKGTKDSEVKLKYQQDISNVNYAPEKPAGVPANFTFAGWYDNEPCEGTAYDFSGKTMPAQNITLYAKWQAPVIKATVYLTASADGEFETIEIPYGTKLSDSEAFKKLLEEKFTEEKPSAWIDSNNGALFNVDTELYSSVTISPFFPSAKDGFTVTYVEGESKKVDNQKYVSGSSARVLPPENSENFRAWETEEHTLIHPGDKITVTKNTTLTAVYTNKPQTETITYHYNFGGSTQTFEDRGYPKNTNATVRSRDYVGFTAPTGYKFLGWATAPNNNTVTYEVGATVFIDANGKNDLYAVWQVKTYTVKWVNWNGTVLQTETDVAYNTMPKAYTGEAPTKPSDEDHDYKFTGWDNERKPVTGNQVYKAQYEASFNVTYELDGGAWTTETEDTFRKFKKDQVNVIEAVPTKEGYTFAGWTYSEDNSKTYTKGNSFTMPAKDVTLTAKWDINKYTVKWVNWNDEVLQTELNVAYNTMPKAYTGEAPTKPSDEDHDYKFTGWDKEREPVTGNQVYKAQYEASFNVTYDLDGGAWTTETEDTFRKFEKDQVNVIEAVPTKEGYTFAGWTTSDVTLEGKSFTMPAKNVTLTAQWNINKYTVTWVNWNDEVLQTELNVAYNTMPKAYTGEAPTKPSDDDYDYKFTGWDKERELVTDNQVYKAQYEASFNVTYELNGGAWTETEDTFRKFKNDQVNVIEAVPTKEGYTFAGWTYSEDNSTYKKGDSFTMPAKDVTLTAKWEANTYKVTYELAGGSWTEATNEFKYEYKATVEVIKTVPTREGYKFSGWRSEEVTIENGEFTMPAKNVVLKAVWEVIPTPTPIPSEEPTPTPTPTPTPAPTEQPTEKPTPTPAPTAEPTSEPTATPTATPSAEPTAEPTTEPTTTPAPNPNPATPTPAPVTPVVPATVATPTPTPTATPSAAPTATPSDNGGKGDGNNDGEIGETINDNETPLTNGEDIADNATPLAGLGTGAWALINLILTIVTTLLSILLLIGYIGKKKKALEDEDGNVVLDENGKEVMEYEKNKKGLWRLISIIPALIAIIVFIFTEDMTLPMIFVDKWTILHVVIALVQVVVMVLCKKKKDENDEDENAANA